MLHRICLPLLILSAVLQSGSADDSVQVDVAIYGGTPGGIAAALAAAQTQRSVLLIEPTDRIGGLMTSGLSHTDFHSFESLTGTFREFADRVEQHYATTYGPDSAQVEDSFRGTHGEPKVNLAILQEMLAEHPSIRVLSSHRLRSVETADMSAGQRIVSITLDGPKNEAVTVRAEMWIDGSYEGDLLAAAGVPWRAGREGRDEYGESLAPVEADDQLQAYNFRFIMTRDPENRVTPVAPPGYRREDFLPVLDVLESGQIEHVFAYPRGCIFKAHEPRLPNGKYDINDTSRGVIRLSLPGANLGWPDGDAAERERISAEHLRDQSGLLYFLQNDEAVPTKFRDEAREWGWCRDEFVETGHLPPQLYVREARRMVGAHVFNQSDSEHAPGDVRAVRHPEAIAMADYGNNCHGTAHEGPRFGGKHTGEFYNPVPPYQVPYGVLLPRQVENLLVPVAASSSHVGFCGLRLEPIWMSLGQAAGHAASQALQNGTRVQDVDVTTLQRTLHGDGSATIYFSDVLPGSPDFEMAQWWGTAGGFHGLAEYDGKSSPRGRKISSQYTHAAPHHAADLDQPLSPELAENWKSLSRGMGIDPASLPAADGTLTRREFLKAAWLQRR